MQEFSLAIAAFLPMVLAVTNSAIITSKILTYRCKRYGADAWLVEFAEHAGDESFAVAGMVRQQLVNDTPQHLIEWTFSYTRVLLEFDKGYCPEEAPMFYHIEKQASISREKIIPCHYNGPDLERVARHCGMPIDEVVARHCAPLYRVHFLGFAPGFPYLSGLDPRLSTPRLDAPRSFIPAGSIGIGGEQTGIYPLPTPGGWNLIGHTTLEIFQPSAIIDSAFHFQPGDMVRFVPTDA